MVQSKEVGLGGPVRPENWPPAVNGGVRMLPASPHAAQEEHRPEQAGGGGFRHDAVVDGQRRLLDHRVLARA